MKASIQGAAEQAHAALRQSDLLTWVDKDPGDFRFVMVDGDIDVIAVVRAVLTSIREPSEAMVRAGMTAVLQRSDDATESYRAMIDELLKEQAG